MLFDGAASPVKRDHRRLFLAKVIQYSLNAQLRRPQGRHFLISTDDKNYYREDRIMVKPRVQRTGGLG
jgi:hypothetical protein